jgi:hypothetical protein
MLASMLARPAPLGIRPAPARGIHAVPELASMLADAPSAASFLGTRRVASPQTPGT